MQNFKESHEVLLNKCKNLIFLSNEIKTNGIIEIYKPKIDFFLFLCKTIISQQISDKVAASIWKKLCVNLSNKKKISLLKNSNDLIYKIDNIGISKRKVGYIVNLFHHVKKNKIFFDELSVKEDSEIRDELIRIKGIGEWTIDIFLIFFLMRPNIFPEKDLIINKVSLKICEMEKSQINFKKDFSPHLSLLSLHFWKMSQRILK